VKFEFFRGRVKVTVHNFVKFVTADVLSESLERIDSVGPADFVDRQTRFREGLCFDRVQPAS
jgi:hypothetical protein